MANLQTTYMGLQLKNPIVVGACSLSKRIDTVKQIEAAGAGALVLKSLFEEQVQLERAEYEAELSQYDEMYAEAVNLFPKVQHGGPKEFLFWVKEARKAVSMPLIASLNAISESVWVDYAKQLAETGVDGLELNFYSPPLDPSIAPGAVEQQEFDAFAKVREAVKIPLAVKLHPYYTNMFYTASEFAKRGADALILFNRLFQPDLNVEELSERQALVLSQPTDSLVPLRWTALLHGKVDADLISSTGITTGKDVAKMVLAGATAVQVVSAIYRNKVTHISAMLEELSGWMDSKGYSSLADFRGQVSKQKVKDPWGFERAQYIKALLGFD